MVKPLPVRIKPDQLARDNSRFEAEIPLGQFDRLNAVLATGEAEQVEGVVKVVANFSERDEHVAVNGRLKTSFPLICQRCLEPMTLAVDVPYELIFVDSEAAANHLHQSLDPVVLDEHGQIHQSDLFEDELLLAVPDFPRHGEGEACAAPEQSFGELDGDAEDSARRRPFEALRDLDLH